MRAVIELCVAMRDMNCNSLKSVLNVTSFNNDFG